MTPEPPPSLYAPARRSFRPVAAAELAVLGPPAAGPRTQQWALDLVRESAAQAAPWGRRLESAVTPAVLTSGEAVLMIADVPSGRWSRTVTRMWTWLVLPVGTNRTVRLRFQTQDLGLFDELGEVSRAVAESVVVSLAATP